MNADGSGQRRLTSDRAAKTNPALSPDGTKIAFQVHGGIPGRSRRIRGAPWSTDATPSPKRNPQNAKDQLIAAWTGGRLPPIPRVMRPVRLLAVLTTLAAVIGWLLASIPAAHAAFLGKRGMVFVSGKTTLSGETDILSFAYRSGTATLVQDYTPHNHKVNLSPTVSPEGGPHIVFVEKVGAHGQGDIYVMDRYLPGGGPPKPIQLTRDSDDEEQPAWSPSGGKIAYVRVVGGTPQIWTMSLSGLNQEALTCCHVKGTRGRGSAGPRSMGPNRRGRRTASGSRT